MCGGYTDIRVCVKERERICGGNRKSWSGKEVKLEKKSARRDGR